MGTLAMVSARSVLRVDTIKVNLAKIEVHQIYMVMYVLIAVLTIWFPQGAIRWLRDETGITPEPISLAFGVCALIIGYKPSRRLFLACTSPLILYGVITTTYTLYIASSVFSLVSTWMLIMSIALMLMNYYRRLGNVRIWHIYSFCMVILGLAIMNHPDRGTAGWLKLTYGVPGQTFGLLMVLAAMAITLKPTRSVFMYAVITTLGIYIVAAAVYALSTPAAGATSFMVSCLTISSITWSFGRMNLYFDES
jgi:hypothetical protein